MNKRQVQYIKHSIAFCDELGNIYINKHLKTYNNTLYKEILKHEKSHTVGKYNKTDWQIDFNNNVNQWELFKFCLKYPAGFLQYLPISKVNGIWTWSLTGILKTIITLAVIIIICFSCKVILSM